MLEFLGGVAVLAAAVLGISMLVGISKALEGLFGREQPPPPGFRSDSNAVLYARSTDTWADISRDLDTHCRRQLYMGVTQEGSFVLSGDRRHVLILGPPRCFKTTGVLVPMIMSAPGPVVSTSIKDDVYRATAQSRSRMGRLWHFNLSDEPTLAGACELRWSPIPPSRDWDTALRLGRALATTSDVAAGATDSAYFRAKASELIAALLHAAALDGKDVAWLLRAVGEVSSVLESAQDILANTRTPEADIAADLLHSIVQLDSRSRGSIFSTTSSAFAAYRSTSARATTSNPNFDPDAFVAGGPGEPNHSRLLTDFEYRLTQTAGIVPDDAKGIFDTIYITADSDKQNLVAPLVVGLLSEIRQATYQRSRRDDAEGFIDRRPVLFALDEVANLAPLRDLPAILSQGAAQNLLVAAVMQDLSQAKARWETEGDGFLTLFGEVIVFPEIRNEATLRQISELIGKRWVKKTSTSFGETRTKSWSRAGSGGSVSRSESETDTEHLIADMDISEVRQVGRNDVSNTRHPHRILVIQSSGKVGIAQCTPYFNSKPFLQATVSSVEYLANYASPYEARAVLPLPGLGLEDVHVGGAEIGRRLVKSLNGLGELRRQRNEILEWLPATPLLVAYVQEDAQHPFFYLNPGQRPVRSVVLVEDLLDEQEIARVLRPSHNGLSRCDESKFSDVGVTPQWALADVFGSRIEVAVIPKHETQMFLGFYKVQGTGRTAIAVYSADRLGLTLANSLTRALNDEGHVACCIPTGVSSRPM